MQSNHNGAGLEANYCCPGVPTNGTNKFYVGLENSRLSLSETSPGPTHLYIYHPGQRSQWGDHWYPDGTVAPNTSIPGDFGPYFVPRPNHTAPLDRWHAVELMVKANTPGQADGRIAFWVDGVLIADYPSVRLREVATLGIDKVSLSFHINGTTPRENFKWYDNVVVARSYIGPRVSAPSRRFRTVSFCRWCAARRLAGTSGRDGRLRQPVLPLDERQVHAPVEHGRVELVRAEIGAEVARLAIVIIADVGERRGLVNGRRRAGFQVQVARHRVHKPVGLRTGQVAC